MVAEVLSPCVFTTHWKRKGEERQCPRQPENAWWSGRWLILVTWIASGKMQLQNEPETSKIIVWNKLEVLPRIAQKSRIYTAICFCHNLKPYYKVMQIGTRANRCRWTLVHTWKLPHNRCRWTLVHTYLLGPVDSPIQELAFPWDVNRLHRQNGCSSWQSNDNYPHDIFLKYVP